jgi:hypothetical protein
MKILKKFKEGALVQMEGEDSPTIMWISNEQLKIVELFKLVMQKGRANSKHIVITTPRRVKL